MYLGQVTRYDILYAVNLAGKDNVQAVQVAHGGSEASTSLLGWNDELFHHLQVWGFQTDGVLGR